MGTRRAKAPARESRSGAPAGGEAPAEARRCSACERELRGPAEVGWECECGVAVCGGADCFDECFKLVAGGEGTRCRSCGLVM